MTIRPAADAAAAADDDDATSADATAADDTDAAVTAPVTAAVSARPCLCCEVDSLSAYMMLMMLLCVCC